jgi:hypothetical protein
MEYPYQVQRCYRQSLFVSYFNDALPVTQTIDIASKESMTDEWQIGKDVKGSGRGII